MSKNILFDQKAKEALQRGIDKVANVVKITLGPRGRNVAIDKGYGAPTITNDGVSIAKEIELKDKFENMGAEIAKEVASKTNDIAGDGTPTSVILVQTMIKEGLKRILTGVNAMEVRQGIEDATNDVVRELRKIAKPIKSSAEIKQVAIISAEAENIGTIIADTIKKVGQNGVVTVEESQSFGVDSEVVDGMEFDQGYVSPYMITNPERMESEYKDSVILVTDKKISSIQEILPLLEKITQTGKKDLVIIADEIEGEALATFVVNKLRGGFNVLAIKAPGFGDRKKEILEDIAVMVGAKVISGDVGLKFDTVDLNVLGRARKVISTKDKTVIVGGKGKRTQIDSRITQLIKQREVIESKFDIEKLDERIGRLSGGVAVVRVGAATETEMKYLKAKIEDAIAATKAAIEEGVVPGGGSAFVKVSKKLDLIPSGNSSAWEMGYSIVVEALKSPLKQIVFNAGKDDGAVIIDKVKRGGVNSGYDANKDEVIEDMFKAGILDPVKVTRTALQNASSAAGIFLTTDVAITDEITSTPNTSLNNSHDYNGNF